MKPKYTYTGKKNECYHRKRQVQNKAGGNTKEKGHESTLPPTRVLRAGKWP